MIGLGIALFLAGLGIGIIAGMIVMARRNTVVFVALDADEFTEWRQRQMVRESRN